VRGVYRRRGGGLDESSNRWGLVGEARWQMGRGFGLEPWIGVARWVGPVASMDAGARVVRGVRPFESFEAIVWQMQARRAIGVGLLSLGPLDLSSSRGPHFGYTHGWLVGKPGLELPVRDFRSFPSSCPGASGSPNSRGSCCRSPAPPRFPSIEVQSRSWLSSQLVPPLPAAALDGVEPRRVHADQPPFPIRRWCS